MGKYKNEWVYNGRPFDNPEKEHVGFVYIITNSKTGRMYIGKKLFWKKVRYKTKPKIRLKDSNWRDYYGSSKWLKEDIEDIGERLFKREILKLCKSKGELSYCEIEEQINRGVLFSDTYYNNFVGCRIHGKTVATMLEERGF